MNLLKKIYQTVPTVREIRLLRAELVQSQLRAELVQNQSASHLPKIARDTLLLHPRYGDPLRLPRYESQTSSQNGEDGAIAEIFHRLGMKSRIFVEVGVGDGSENNTVFWAWQGWRGFWIEGNESFCEVARERVKKADVDVTVIQAMVTGKSIVSILDLLHKSFTTSTFMGLPLLLLNLLSVRFAWSGTNVLFQSLVFS